MGWAVLYFAFAVVALWLLGEVLLQYKARLRWRLLAFAGFLGVVLGVAIPSVVVIALGGMAFAVGQTCVTLSFRRGFTTGWAVGGPLGKLGAGTSRRRRAGGQPARAARSEPTLEVSELEAVPVPDAPDGPAAAQEPAGAGPAAQAGSGAYAASGDRGAADAAGYDAGGYGGYGAYGGYAPGAVADGGPAAAGHGGYAPAGTYGYGADGYPAYPDPYATAAQPQGYEPYGHGYDPYAAQPYATGPDPYGQQAGYPAAQPYAVPGPGATPAAGVWVPQQRDGDMTDQQPDQQPYPHPYLPDGGDPYR
ncbi:hypothetical protein RKE29_25045 [Streptomyces sp. B1866]|uniref:hypothetical protein n=1 Tax=Streptomyces sp. B1866 TaxID=3075431 RepID=UPI002892231D|nr:hypothetical protein [Streptomyces sp. B1866]MDT3399863.1 hypothetical protein [Streptomyces sp. B1866]